jgi:hypothetical protein
MKSDADYRTQQKLSQQKWLERNPDYWRRYRQQNPDKAVRNRALQHIRNRRNRGSHPDPPPPLIAKMDARKGPDFNLVGPFYLVPLIAKMDVRKVNIYTFQRVAADCKDGREDFACLLVVSRPQSAEKTTRR